MPSTLLRVLSAAGCALVLTACGGSGGTSAQTSTALQERVGSLVEAVNAEDYPGARTALAALRADVEDAKRLGALDDTRAADLDRLADDVAAGLPAPPSPSPAATRAPVQAPPAVRETPQEQPAEEPGKGKGRDKDDDDEDDD